MNKTLIAILASTAFVGLGMAAPRKAATVLAAADYKWAEMPNTGGVQVVPIKGDMARGAHEAMVTFPASAVHALHTHTAEIKIVVVSGTFTYGPEGGPEKQYGPGSYIAIPGNLRHTSGCTSAAPCVIYHAANGKFDLKAVPEKKS